MRTGAEATVCPADIHWQHPGVSEPIPDVWNLWARAGAAVQRAGPGREPPVSVSGAGRGDSLGSRALSELGVGAGGGGQPNSFSPSLAIAPSGLQATVLQNCRLSSGQGALREHSPRGGCEAGLATRLGRGASCLPTGRFGSTGQGLPRNPLACLSSHLFAIANLAFAKMLDAKQNQCIIIR